MRTYTGFIVTIGCHIMIIAFVPNPEASPFYRIKRSVINSMNQASLSILAAGTLFAAWLLIQDITKQRIIDDISIAVTSGNIHMLVKNTDWESVRHHMKRDLQHRSRHNVSLPQKPHELSALVDYYIRPENVPVLFEAYRRKASHMNVRDFVRRSYFSGLTEVTLELASPPQFDKPWLNRQPPVRAVFKLRGMGWTLHHIDAPDYLIPTQALALKKSDHAKVTPTRLATLM